MFGDRAVTLLKELRSLAHLPLYNENAIREIVHEIDALHEQIKQQMQIHEDQAEEVSAESACGLIVHHKCIARNKRCVLAYLAHRVNRVKDMWWELGTVIPAEIRQNMSLKEREFFTVYDKLMSTYVSHFPELDLTSDQEPPKELNIEVRVLEDCGDVMTERGVVELKKGSTVFCRRADVSLLIRRGALEQTENKD